MADEGKQRDHYKKKLAIFMAITHLGAAVLGFCAARLGQGDRNLRIGDDISITTLDSNDVSLLREFEIEYYNWIAGKMTDYDFAKPENAELMEVLLKKALCEKISEATNIPEQSIEISWQELDSNSIDDGKSFDYVISIDNKKGVKISILDDADLWNCLEWLGGMRGFKRDGNYVFQKNSGGRDLAEKIEEGYKLLSEINFGKITISKKAAQKIGGAGIEY